MWSSRTRARPRIFGLTVNLLGLLALMGCGFAPVYGDNGVTARAADRMAEVEIAPIEAGLTGLYLRNDLIDRINGSSEPTTPRHRLQVALASQFSSVLVQPDASITFYDYYLEAHFELIDLAKNEVVFSGRSRTRSGYNVVESEYATLVARRDAERRAAEALSEEVTLRVALYLRQ